MTVPPLRCLSEGACFSAAWCPDGDGVSLLDARAMTLDVEATQLALQRVALR